MVILYSQAIGLGLRICCALQNRESCKGNNILNNLFRIQALQEHHLICLWLALWSRAFLKHFFVSSRYWWTRGDYDHRCACLDPRHRNHWSTSYTRRVRLIGSALDQEILARGSIEHIDPYRSYDPAERVWSSQHSHEYILISLKNNQIWYYTNSCIHPTKNRPNLAINR